MEFNLHKLEEGFIITSDEEIKEGDKITTCGDIDDGVIVVSTFKEGHLGVGKKVILEHHQIDLCALSEEDQKEIGFFDLHALADACRSHKSIIKHPDPHTNVFESGIYQGYQIGFLKALELTSDKKFTLEDMKEAVRVGVNIGTQNIEQPKYENDFNFNQDKAIQESRDYIQSLPQPKSWKVELEMEESLVVEGYVFDGTNDGELTWKKRPKFSGGKVKIIKLL